MIELVVKIIYFIIAKFKFKCCRSLKRQATTETELDPEQPSKKICNVSTSRATEMKLRGEIRKLKKRLEIKTKHEKSLKKKCKNNKKHKEKM